MFLLSADVGPDGPFNQQFYETANEKPVHGDLGAHGIESGIADTTAARRSSVSNMFLEANG